MNKGRKPDILCIGAQKAGTSWLHVTLATRRDIWVPPFKELHFFDHNFRFNEYHEGRLKVVNAIH